MLIQLKHDTWVRVDQVQKVEVPNAPDAPPHYIMTADGDKYPVKFDDWASAYDWAANIALQVNPAPDAALSAPPQEVEQRFFCDEVFKVRIEVMNGTRNGWHVVLAGNGSVQVAPQRDEDPAVPRFRERAWVVLERPVQSVPDDMAANDEAQSAS